VAEQLRVLHDDIGRWTGRTPNLKKAMQLSNRASVAWAHVMQKRLAGRLEMNGPAHVCDGVPGQLLWARRPGAKDFERLLSERGRSDMMAPVLDGGRRLKRLLWLHTVPHHDADLFSCSRSRAPWSSSKEMGQMHLETVDPDDPFRDWRDG